MDLPELPPIQVQEGAASTVPAFKLTPARMQQVNDAIQESKNSRTTTRIVTAISLLMVAAIICLIGVLLYIEVQPNPAKGFAGARTVLAESVKSAQFKINMSFNMTYTVNGQAIDSVVSFEGIGRFDRASRAIQISGQLKLPNETLPYTQTQISNDLYIKYADKDYVRSTNPADAVFSVADLDLQNIFPQIGSSPQFGYGEEEELVGKRHYRYRVYPSDEIFENYIRNFVGKFVQLSYPELAGQFAAGSSGLGVTDPAYRMWASVYDYIPSQLQYRFAGIEISFSDGNRVDITDYVSTVVFETLNQGATVVAPTL